MISKNNNNNNNADVSVSASVASAPVVVSKFGRMLFVWALLSLTQLLPTSLVFGAVVMDRRVLEHPRFRRAAEGREVPGEFIVEYDLAPLMRPSKASIVSGNGTTTLTSSIKRQRKAYQRETDDLCVLLASCGGYCSDEVMMDAMTGFRITHTDDDCVLQLLEQEQHDNFRVYHAQWFTISAVQTQDIDRLWGLDRIDERDYPLDGRYKYDYNGEGVEVYIADTGIDTSHPEFSNQQPSGGVECAYDAISAGCGDGRGHGTHVAGTACGKTVGT